MASFGTRPKILRSDGGQPFDSKEFQTWATAEGITVVIGVPHHSQGQGKVETRFRPTASAIMATLGALAPTDWAKNGFLIRLESVIKLHGRASDCRVPFVGPHGARATDATVSGD